MRNLFRSAAPGPSDFAALALTVVVLLSVLGLLIAPRDQLATFQPNLPQIQEQTR